jgi:hypothetical protein
MPTRTLSLYIILAMLVPLLNGQTATRPGSITPKYVVVAQLPLSQSENQIDGKLQILEDARLTPPLRKALWGSGDVNVEEDPSLAEFKADPPHNAMVRVVARKGVVQTFPLERSLVRLEAAKLYGTPHLTYLVTVDYSAGFGSYNGPVTMPLEVRNGRLQWLKATEKANGKEYQIELMRSLKTVWKIVDSPSGAGKEILYAMCRPDLKRPVFTSSDANPQTTDDDFILTYARYYFDGYHWIRVKRTQHRYTDFEEGFPGHSLFP